MDEPDTRSTATRDVNTETPQPSIRTDAPLDDEGEDRLDRRHFARAVARLIADRSDPTSVVVGIYAPWGDGKTTILNWIARRLDHPDSGVVVVRFNPWLVRDEMSLLPTFFATVSEALGERLGGRKQQIAEILQRYGRVVAGLSVGIPGVSFDPGATIAKLGEAMAGNSIEQMREEFEAILVDSKQRLLVIVDDVDRLDDDETYAVFKLVKLAADFDGVTYLMAFDDGKVAAALSKRYSGARGANDPGAMAGGFDFLEKIVQLPLRLPRARKHALDLLVLEGLEDAVREAGVQLSDGEVREFQQRYYDGLSPAIRSVRVAKRYASAASFALSLLKGETYPIDVLTVEGINVCYPSVYSALREQPSWFLLPYEFHLSSGEKDMIERGRARLDSVLEQLEPAIREPVKKLLQLLFPQTQQLWSSSGTGREREEWASQQRVCSAEYFDRYFSYGVADREIGDQELDDLLRDPDEYGTRIADLVERKGGQAIWQLIEKSDRRLERLGSEQLVALAESVVALGPRVVGDDEPRFLARNLFEESASFIARILLTMPEDSLRTGTAEHIVSTAEPLIFAAECFRWMMIKKSAAEPLRALDKDQARNMERLLANRIVSWADELRSPMWETRHGLRLMYIAARGDRGDDIQQHVRKWLETSPQHVVALLASAAGQLYGAEAVVQDDLTTDTFATLDRIAAMDDLTSAVTVLRGNDPVPDGFPAARYASAAGKATDRIVLDQFAWQRARQEGARAMSTDKVPTAAEGNAVADADTMAGGFD